MNIKLENEDHNSRLCGTVSGNDVVEFGMHGVDQPQERKLTPGVFQACECSHAGLRACLSPRAAGPGRWHETKLPSAVKCVLEKRWPVICA